MLVHHVLFWLDRSLTAADRADFAASAKTLATCPSVRQCFFGPPSSTARPVVDRTYDFALTVVFDDMKGHDAYQVEPIHLRFIEAQKHKWIRAVITDSEVEHLRS